MRLPQPHSHQRDIVAAGETHSYDPDPDERRAHGMWLSWRAWLLLESARVGRDVDGMLLQCCEWHDLQHRLIGGGQHDGRRDAVAVSSGPVHRRNAPAVARRESGEAILRSRSGQVVADAALVLEELGRDDGADGVAPDILRSGAAAAVAKEPGHRVRATRLQFAAKDIAFCH